MALPFVVHALQRGLALGRAEEQLVSRLFHQGALVSNGAIYGHMIAGALITLLAPVQLSAGIRARWPLLHRAIGYVVAGAAVVTATGGLCYIAVRGTIGGPVMDVGFSLYGVLMLLCVAMTVHFARRRHPLHRLWAERLVILALASWLYRVHYGIWEVTTGGIGTLPDFSGLFDQVQVFAFYLPYLLLHSLVWQNRGSLRARLN